VGGGRLLGAIAAAAPYRDLARMHVVLAVQTCEQMHIQKLGFAESSVKHWQTDRFAELSS
jgi:hypothetical protein